MNGKIRIRHIYKATELKRFHKLEGKYHRMGKTHSGGDTMRVVFEDENGKWLALMVWGSACYHLRPRDEYIGWNMALRRARQKLVANNRRFTILAKPGEHPNLASRCLGLALRELPRGKHDFPLLVTAVESQATLVLRLVGSIIILRRLFHERRETRRAYPSLPVEKLREREREPADRKMRDFVSSPDPIEQCNSFNFLKVPRIARDNATIVRKGNRGNKQIKRINLRRPFLETLLLFAKTRAVSSESVRRGNCFRNSSTARTFFSTRF